MDLLVKNNPNHYDTGDIIYIAPDGHQWGGGELDTNVFTIVTGVTLTDRERELLLMPDDMINFSSYSMLPTFRSLSLKGEQLNYLNRRKYQLIAGSVELKPNAQVKE